MPTNLKSLLTRSRSKNELKLRDSKDELSISGNGENSDVSPDSLVYKCESSEHHNCLVDACCCRQSYESPNSLNVSSNLGSSSSSSSSYLQTSETDSASDLYPGLSHNSNYERDVSPEDRCFVPESFLKSLKSETCSASTMIHPPGNSFHRPHHHQHQHHHQQHRGCLTSQKVQNGYVTRPYQSGSPHYSSSAYDAVPTAGVVGVGASPGDYCVDDGGYYLDEKSTMPCTSSRMVGGVMDQTDNGGEMRRNASCKTLFFSCSALHQHPSCTSFESSHLDPTSEFSPTSCENRHHHHQQQHSSLTSGNVAAVPPSMKMPSLSHAGDGRTNVASGSMACTGSPSAACCTFNAKDGSSCQSLSMRKCETVLALSNLNGTSVSTSTTTAPLATNSSKSYVRNSTSGAATTAYSNFAASSGTTMSHLSSSSGVPSTSSNNSNSNGNVGGKVRGMKDKIFSTSSSALNCLLHSSSRTGKLLSSWKLSSGSSSSNSGSNTNVGHVGSIYSGSTEGNNCLGVNCQQNKHYLGSSSTSQSDNNKLGSIVNNSSSAKISSHQHHKSRSQLSISENSFSSSPAPLTPVNRLRRNVSVNNTGSFCPTNGSLSAHSSYSRSSSVASFGWKENEGSFEQSLLCRLCLCNVPLEETMEIHACSCRYCKDCLITYVSFEIQQGADEIACPDASCEKQGVLGLSEVEHLVPPILLEKHKKFIRFREVEKDSQLMWCPSPGCETVCQIQDGSNILTGGFVTENDRAHGGAGGGVVVAAAGGSRSLPYINCPTCQKFYCAECKLSWHPDSSCESFRRKLIKQGKLSSEDDELFSLDSIKKCPFCHVPIEKDSGCAQMMCKRCKHVFCWYCLASLDDDFLLRHYDKGPCKNKLGHSRASVVWHRAQVIGIFAGFGVLVLLASPLLILAAPCLLCCRCRYCANKLDPEESDLV